MLEQTILDDKDGIPLCRAMSKRGLESKENHYAWSSKKVRIFEALRL